jgi:histidine phosphotransferase ChpT
MMRLPPKFMEINSGQVEEAIDAHSIQPYYTVMLADEAGMVMKAEQTPEEIIFTASMATAAT